MILKALRPETPRVRKLILFSMIVMLCFCVIVGFQALNSYLGAVRQGKDDATRLARILSDHVELTLLSVDLSLRRAVERQYFNSLFGGNLPEYMEHNFSMWVRELPQISAMMLINEEGYVEAAAYEEGFDNFVVTSKSVEGTELLAQGQKQDTQDSYFYFTPGFKKGDPKSQVIVMSRKLNKLDGSYGGVVLAAIDPRYFVDFFDSIAHGKQHFMNIALSDGTSMVSGPNSGEHFDKLKKYLTKESTALYAANKVRTEQLSFDTKTKIFSYRSLGSFPVTVGIALDSKDYLSFWRSNQSKDVLFLAIFLLFGTALSLFAVTMEKQIKRVQQSESSAVLASQTKSEFLANMSHEFRTPLNAIIGFSEMLMSGYFGSLTSKQKERILDINLCGNHLLQLINDILEFSKAEAGKLELKEEVVDIRETVEECHRMMREKMNLRQVSFAHVLDSRYPWVYADKRKLRQVLLNLLSNSIKFTPQGGTITVSTFAAENGFLHLRVKDTGIGIPEQDVAKALSVFGQVHRSQSLEGTGLGLPLCKIFAELHGGTLILRSTVGEGTMVDITLPPSRILNEDQVKNIVAASQAALQAKAAIQKLHAKEVAASEENIAVANATDNKQ